MGQNGWHEASYAEEKMPRSQVGRAQDVSDMHAPVGQRCAYARPTVWVPQESLKNLIILPLVLMTQREKLSAMIRQNPKAVRFEDACKVAGWLGFIHEGGQGSHRVFKRPGEPMQLNFQNCNGVIPPYQARQLIAMLNKYGK